MAMSFIFCTNHLLLNRIFTIYNAKSLNRIVSQDRIYKLFGSLLVMQVVCAPDFLARISLKRTSKPKPCPETACAGCWKSADSARGTRTIVNHFKARLGRKRNIYSEDDFPSTMGAIVNATDSNGVSGTGLW